MPLDGLLAVVRRCRAGAGAAEARLKRIELIRHALRRSDRLLEFEDFGAGRDGAHADSPVPRRTRVPVSRLVRASVPEPIGRLFYGLVRAYRPGRCLEMGTNLGISGMYLAVGLAANRRGRLWTLDAAESSLGVARDNLEQVAPGVARVLPGVFERALQPTLRAMGGVDLAFIDGNHRETATWEYFDQVRQWTRPGSLLVFDDIAAHDGMCRAWERVRGQAGLAAALEVCLAGRPALGLVLCGQSGTVAEHGRCHLDRPLARVLSLARRRVGRWRRRLWRRA